jgi:hypothetical protein
MSGGARRPVLRAVHAAEWWRHPQRRFHAWVPLIVSDDERSLITTRRVRVRDRLSARLRAFALDRALAGGEAPDSSVALELRATVLMSARQRLRLANRLGGVLLGGESNLHPALRLTSVSPSLIRETRAEFLLLLSRLLDDEPVEVRGLAMVRVLLADGRSPLYDPSPGDAEQLRDALTATTAALDPSST